MLRLRQAMVDFCTEHHPLSVRNLHYLMAQNGFTSKDDKGYRFVMEQSGILRENGQIPFPWLKDETRQAIQVYTCDSIADGLNDLLRQYRRNVWTNQPCYVELWCEAKASIATLTPLCHQWPGLRLIPVGGFSSKSFLWECAQHLGNIDKPIHIVYAGDFDPSGLGIEADIQTRMERYVSGLSFTVHRIAITEQQMVDWDLPVRAPKQNDPRMSMFTADSVAELEAIPPQQLRQMCNDAIRDLMDMDLFAATKSSEAADIKKLTKYVARVK